MRRTLLAAATAALAALPLVGFAQDLPTLRIGLADDPDLLDPTLARSFVGRIVFAGLCDKLVDIDAKLNVVPQLAQSYEWTDSKTLVFKLRPGLTFHDGTPLDAEAVKFSMERHLTMQGSSRRGEISTLDHVEVVDPTTVKMVLKTPTSPFLAALTDRAGMIVSPTAAKAEGKDFALHPVCAGPFKFAERVAQDHITLDRFDKYWDASAIKIGHIIYRTVTDPSVRLANIEAGALDMAERIQPTDVATVQKNPKLKLVVYPGLGYQGITFNVDHGPRAKTALGENALVREAFSLAIDRGALVQVVYNGMFTPTVQAVSPASPYYAESVKVPARDVAKAKALLQQAGVKLPVDVDLTVTNNATQKQEGEVIQSMVQEAGFNLKVHSVEFATSLDADDRGDFQAHLIGWSGRTDPDGNLYSFLHSGAPLNVSGYKSAEMDKLLEEGRAVSDVAKRKEIYAKIAALTVKDAPLIYLYSGKWITAMSSKVDGYVPVADGMIRPQGITISK
jgi:peptide/nickel transport system substrate-binding protein